MNEQQKLFQDQARQDGKQNRQDTLLLVADSFEDEISIIRDGLEVLDLTDPERDFVVAEIRSRIG